jgi:drug/metabolite transporter (DMT)-like permease
MVVLLALGAAALFGASSVLMHTQARAAPASGALNPTLFVHLARRPAWLAGIGTQMAGFGLVATALEMGSLSLVQAIIPAGLLLALPLAARVSGKNLRRSDWAGAAATVGGLAVLLAVASPATGRSSPTAEGWLVLFTSTFAATGALVVVSGRVVGAARAVALATAAGIMLALNAVVTKAAATRFSHGLGQGVSSWETYALAIVGLLGLLLMQNAFQAGDIEWSLPTLTVANPVVSVVFGMTALDESIAVHGALVAVVVASLVVMVGGVIALASSPALIAIHEQAPPEVAAPPA